MEAAVLAFENEFGAPGGLREVKFVRTVIADCFVDHLPPLFGGEFPDGSEFAGVNETRARCSLVVPIHKTHVLGVRCQQFSEFDRSHGEMGQRDQAPPLA